MNYKIYGIKTSLSIYNGEKLEAEINLLTDFETGGQSIQVTLHPSNLNYSPAEEINLEDELLRLLQFLLSK